VFLAGRGFSGAGPQAALQTLTRLLAQRENTEEHFTGMKNLLRWSNVRMGVITSTSDDSVTLRSDRSATIRVDTTNDGIPDTLLRRPKASRMLKPVANSSSLTARPIYVDTKGSGFADHIAIDTTGDGVVDTLIAALPGDIGPDVDTVVSLPVDTVGDGMADHIAIDTTGDGRVDTILKLSPSYVSTERLSQLQPPGKIMSSAAASRRPLTPARRREAGVNLCDISKIFHKFEANRGGGIGRSELREALVTMFNPKLDCCVKISDALLDELLAGRKVVKMAEFSEIITRVADDPRTIESSVLGAGKQLPFQEAVRDFYKHPVTSGAAALMIMANFVINIVEKEIDPDANDLLYPGFWYGADTFFNIVFLFELWANLWGYGGPVREWITGWNIFDTIIVAVGVMTMSNVLGPPFDKLKLMRAFRVFRLFKRVKELNQIIVSILKSIPAVSYAFVAMFIFFAIYAILGVELFHDFGEGGHYETYDDVTDDTLMISSLTKRGYVYGIEYYGTFSRAMFTLFQVQSGESWSEAVARPLIFGLTSTGGGGDPIVLTYFYSFRLLMKVVLLNVVVAVLLDSFGAGNREDDMDDAVGELTAPSEAAMPTAPSPAPSTPSALSLRRPLRAPSPSTEPPAVISVEAMTKLEKLLGKVGELDSLAEIFSEMQASVGLMKREVALMKTKPLIPRPEPQRLLPRHPNQARAEPMMLTPNPEASLDPPEGIPAPDRAHAFDGRLQFSHRSRLSYRQWHPAAQAAPARPREVPDSVRGFLQRRLLPAPVSELDITHHTT